MGRLVLIAMTLMAAAGASALAAAPQLPPSANSDALLALRGQPLDELRFTYRKQAEGKSDETVAVGLAADYATMQAGGVTTIRDYRLRRLLTILPDQRFTNNSLFAEAWFRGAEVENRLMMRKAASAAGLEDKLPPSSRDPFWIETSLGVVHTALPRPDLVRQEEAGSTRWLLKGGEVAAVRYGADSVPPQFRAGLRRMWATVAAMHPQIADEIAASGRLPAELWLVGEDVAAKDKAPRLLTWHWTLLGSQSVARAAYPLPRGFAATPTETRGAFPALFATLADAVASRKLPAPEQTYVAHAEAAIARGAGLEAFLWITEMRLANGKNGPACAPEDHSTYCLLLRQAAPLFKADSRLGILSSKQPVTAADRHRFDDLANVPLTGVLLATRPRARDVSPVDEEAGLVAALKASPVANFCKDGGDFYLQLWNPNAAWQVMDFGRLMAGHRDGDLLSGVDVLEDWVQRRTPQFF